MIATVVVDSRQIRSDQKYCTLCAIRVSCPHSFLWSMYCSIFPLQIFCFGLGGNGTGGSPVSKTFPFRGRFHPLHNPTRLPYLQRGNGSSLNKRLKCRLSVLNEVCLPNTALPFGRSVAAWGEPRGGHTQSQRLECARCRWCRCLFSLPLEAPSSGLVFVLT